MTIMPIRRRQFMQLALAAALPLRAQAQALSQAPAQAPAPSPADAAHDALGPLLPRHGLSMHDDLALPPNFTAFAYANPQAPKGGTLTLGFQGTYDSLNPFNVRAGSAVSGLAGPVFQSLMARHYDEPFALYPLIARALEMDDARRRIVFHLDPRARFSDGVPLTAADVAFTFDLFRRKGRPQNRAAFALVRSVETPDPHTIVFDLGQGADRELPLIIAMMAVLPRHRVDDQHFDDPSLSIIPGSGAYKIAALEPGTSLVLERDRDWWAQDLPSTRGLYHAERVRMLWFRDGHSLFEAFRSGLVDYRQENDPALWLKGYDYPAMRDGRQRRETVPLPGPKGLAGFALNTRRPLFQDVRVREALGFLFDFEWINTTFYGGLYQRTRSFFDDSAMASTGRAADATERALLAPFPEAVRADIMEGQWAPPRSDGTGRDRALVTQAIELLRAAGWVLREGVMTHVASGAVFDFEIMLTDRATERLALAFADSLRRVGIIARVRVVDDVQYQRRRQTFDFDVTPGLWLASASPGNEQRGRWSAAAADQPSSFNLPDVRAPAADAMIAAVVAARSRGAFEAAVRALDRVLLSGFWVIPFFHAPQAWIASAARLGHPPRALRTASAAPFGSLIETAWIEPGKG
jgi:peptide/nickel transport system substrate-binding protein